MMMPQGYPYYPNVAPQMQYPRPVQKAPRHKPEVAAAPAPEPVAALQPMPIAAPQVAPVLKPVVAPAPVAKPQVASVPEVSAPQPKSIIEQVADDRFVSDKTSFVPPIFGWCTLPTASND